MLSPALNYDRACRWLTLVALPYWVGILAYVLTLRYVWGQPFTDRQAVLLWLGMLYGGFHLPVSLVVLRQLSSWAARSKPPRSLVVATSVVTPVVAGVLPLATFVIGYARSVNALRTQEAGLFAVFFVAAGSGLGVVWLAMRHRLGNWEG